MSISETTVIVIEEEPPARKRPKIVSSCKERGADESVTIHTPKLARHPLCSTGYPSEIERASGQYVYASDGEKCLDACSGLIWHCHPQVVEAGSKQMGSLCTNSRFLYDSMVTCAKGLCETFPGNLSCCFFTNSGSEANELAVQIAETVSGGSKFATLREASHGHSMTHRRLTAATSDHTCPVPLPDVYRGQYQDPETAGELYAREVGQIIAEQDSKGGKIAAFIHESAVCCAGQTVLPPGYLKAVYKHVRAAGGLCVADEQQGGFGRTGKNFWAFQAHGVSPDIVTLGKSMGNGHPVGAVITTKEIAEKFSGSGIEYFNTFGGNPVSMAVAEAVLSVVEGEGLLAQVDTVGTFLKEGLLRLMEQHTCIGDVRGVGLLVGVDFVKNRESKEGDGELASSVAQKLQQDHRILATVSGSVVTFRPPLCISKEDCTSIVQALDSILSKLCA